MIPKLSIFLLILILDHVSPFPNASAGLKLGRRKKLINGIATIFMSHTSLAALAKKMYDRNYYKAAVTYYTKAINKKSTVAEYYIRRAECHLALGNKDEVISDYKAATLYARNSKSIQIELCQTLFYFGGFDQVRVELMALDHEELSSLADAAKYQSKFQEAVIIYDEAIRKYPHEMYYRSRGLCHKDLGNQLAALSDFREAVACRDRYSDNSTRILLIDALLDTQNFDDAKDEMSLLTHFQLSNEGDRYLSQQKFEEAACFYSEAIIKFPHEKYYRSRGICCKEMGYLEDAIFNFREAVSRSREYSDNLTRTYLVEALLAARKFHDAMEEMNRLKDLELIDLGDKFHSRNQFKEAICFYDVMIARNPHEKFYRLRGICHKELGNLKAAISDFGEAVSRPMGCKDNSTRLLLIEVLLADKSLNDALKEMAHLNVSELVNQGHVLSSQNRFEDAVYFYTAAIEKQPSSAGLYKFRANCYTRMGHIENAVSDFHNMIERDTNEVLKCSESGKMIGDNKGIKPQITKSKRSRILLCATLFEVGRLTDAEREMNNFEARQLLDLGDELFERQLFDQSFQCYEEAIRKEPNNPKCHEKRAQFYRKRGSLPTASYDYETALCLDPSNVNIWFDFIELLLEMNDPSRARRVLLNHSHVFLTTQPEHTDRIRHVERTIRDMEEAEARRKLVEAEARVRREAEEARLRATEARRRRRNDDAFLYGAVGGLAVYTAASAGCGGVGCGGGGGGGCGGGGGGGGGCGGGGGGGGGGGCGGGGGGGGCGGGG